MRLAIHAGNTPLFGTFMFVACIFCRFMEPFNDVFVGQFFFFGYLYTPLATSTQCWSDTSHSAPTTCWKPTS